MAANMPYVVARAMADVDTLAVFSELGRAPRAVFRYLVSLVDARNAVEPVWPAKEKIADKTGYAVAQVYRAINTLITAGLITRISQTRYARTGRLGRGLISLTPAACQLLSLPIAAAAEGSIAAQEPAEQASQSGARMPEMIDGHIITQALPDHSQSLQKQSAELGNVVFNKNTTRIGNANVPNELAFVVNEKWLSLGQLLKLMGEAGRVGKRLGDIIAVRHARLSKVPKGNQLLAYLRTLIRSQTDFAWLRAEQKRQITEAAQQKEIQQQFDAARATLAGKCFEGKADHRYQVLALASGLFVECYREGAHLGTRALDAAFLAAVNDGKLRPARDSW